MMDGSTPRLESPTDEKDVGNVESENSGGSCLSNVGEFCFIICLTLCSPRCYALTMTCIGCGIYIIMIRVSNNFRMFWTIMWPLLWIL